jgi:Ca-activated chloride channel family protein
MQLLAPLAFIAHVPLAGAIILLYLLKLRRRDLVVPSVFLWRRAVQDVQANAPFQKLRRNLLLFLQLAALACLVAGLAAPFFLASRLGGKSTVIVLDASASMNATDADGSRFAEARRRAQDIIDGMGRRDEAALVVCANRARVALPFSGDQRRLLSSLNSLQPTDCLTNVRDGLLLALSLAGKRPDARVFVISDGAFPPLPEIASSADIRFLRVGTRSNNIALLAFEAALPVTGTRSAAPEHELFLRLHSFAPEPKHAILSIYHEDDLLDAHELDLPPGQSLTQTYKLLLTEPGLLRAELEVDDDLAADNVAYAFARPASATSVLLVTPGNLFLEQALLVLPDLEAHKLASLSAEAADGAYRDYDVVIFDRVPVPKPPTSGAVMVIAGDPGRQAASLGSELNLPRVTRWEENHPVLRYVNLGAVEIARARALTPAAGAQVLARAGDDPLVVAQEGPGTRLLAFGWNFLDSDLPLRVGFPVLLSNSINWLAQSADSAPAMRVRPGAVLDFPAPPEADRAEVILPDGRRTRISVRDGQVTFADTGRVGPYRLQAADREWRFAVDLRSAAESDLSPADELKLGAKTVQAGTGPPKVEQHLWPLLALLGLAILLGEWHLYHRRY